MTPTSTPCYKSKENNTNNFRIKLNKGPTYIGRTTSRAIK